ncbi:MAG TPA: hypothetical protein VET85_11305 [Stellaceae bacterium]|nr:hypothetical protein [Stellaceae bacterium]
MSAPLPKQPSCETPTPQPRRAVIAASLLIAAMVAAVGVYAWFSLDDSEVSDSGYVALALGVLGTIVLGVGLMALVFFSDRYGYDRIASGTRRENDE